MTTGLFKQVKYYLRHALWPSPEILNQEDVVSFKGAIKFYILQREGD